MSLLGRDPFEQRSHLRLDRVIHLRGDAGPATR